MMLDKIKNYIKDHRGQLAVYGIMATVMVGIGLAAGLHPLDALAKGRR